MRLIIIIYIINHQNNNDKEIKIKSKYNDEHKFEFLLSKFQLLLKKT